jgi:hypothetical protein
MDPLAEYSGLFLLSCLALATITLWFRDRVAAPNDPTRRRRDTRRALAFFACASPPFLVLAIGGIFGSLREPGDFLNVHNGPFAYIFITSVCFVWAALLYWAFVKGGAEELAAGGHLRLLGLPRSNPSTVKLVLIAAIVGGLCTILWKIADALR